MSGLDPNGGGTLVVPGGGTVAAADITDATATGIALVTATDAAAARTAIGVYSAAEVDSAIAASRPRVTQTTYDFTSGASFTADAGTTVGATAAVTAGVARLSLPSTAGTYRYAGNYNGPSITRDLGLVASVLDVAVRISSLPNTGTTQLFLEISESNPGGTRIAAMIAGTGATYCYRQDANTYDAGPTISISTDTWIRIRAADGTVTAYYGTGTSGAIPTAWTEIYTPTTRRVAWRYVALGLVHAGSGVTVDADDLTVLSQERVSL